MDVASGKQVYYLCFTCSDSQRGSRRARDLLRCTCGGKDIQLGKRWHSFWHRRLRIPPSLCENSRGIWGLLASTSISSYDKFNIVVPKICYYYSANYYCLTSMYETILPLWDKISVNTDEKRRIFRILRTLGSLMISYGISLPRFTSSLYALFLKRRYWRHYHAEKYNREIIMWNAQ